MKPDLTPYLEKIYGIIEEAPSDLRKQIQDVFIDIEVEIGYLDQKRDEAEANFRAVLAALNEKEKSEELNVSSWINIQTINNENNFSSFCSYDLTDRM